MFRKEWIQGAFQNNPIGTAIVDVYGNWLGVNRALTRILGYSEAALLKMKFQDITHPDDLNADYVAMRQLMSREIDFFEMEKRYRVKAGHFIWILLTGTLVFSDDGEPLYYIAQIQDISKRVESRTATSKSLGDLNSLVNDSAVVMIRFTPDMRYLYVNDAVEREMGLRPSEMVGCRVDEVNLPPSFMKLVRDALEETITSREPQEREFERPSLGGVKQIVARFQPEIDKDGRLQSIILVSTDITAIKGVERQLRQALAEIRQLQSILPICAYCKHIRDDNDYWTSVENYISKHTDSRFSHSICPECYQTEIVPQLDNLNKPQSSPEDS